LTYEKTYLPNNRKIQPRTPTNDSVRLPFVWD
jgi:hypothetical protein